MGRFKPNLIERAENFAHRVLDVTEALARQRRSPRIVEQMTGCGTSVGANTYEADEALSRPDFCKTIGIIIKELNENRFWLRLAAKRNWIRPARLDPLLAEAAELKRIYGAILTRTRRSSEARPARS